MPENIPLEPGEAWPPGSADARFRPNQWAGNA
jgi:hypothetical protein